MAIIEKSVQNMKASLPHQRLALLLGMTLLVSLLVGVWLTQRLLWPAAPAATITGELVARQMATAIQSSPGVQSAAGAYLPGDSLLLYSRIDATDRAEVRLWALLQLKPFHHRLTQMTAERLQWVIDFGPNAAEQEIILVPLDQVADPTQYSYFSSTPGLLTNVAPAPAAAGAAGIEAQPTVAAPGSG